MIKKMTPEIVRYYNNLLDSIDPDGKLKRLDVDMEVFETLQLMDSIEEAIMGGARGKDAC